MEAEFRTDLHVATGLGSTTPAVYTAWNRPSQLTRRVISRIRTGATRLARRRTFPSSRRENPPIDCHTYVFGHDEGVLHQIEPRRFSSHVVERVGGPERGVDRMVHDRTGQCVKTDEIRHYAANLQDDRRNVYSPALV